MATNSFESRLPTQGPTPPQPFLESFEAIKDIGHSLQRWLNPSVATPDVQVTLEPGFVSAMGQQFNLLLKPAAQVSAETLFRAYIAMNGVVTLDLFGEEPEVCDTPADVEDKLLQFIARPDVQAQLFALKNVTN